MKYVELAGLKVSRFILGSNPFSGFSHQGEKRDREMVRYYTAENIKKTLRQAESLGINSMIGRADRHVVRILREYWDEGGKIQWLAQTCPGVGPTDKVLWEAIEGGCSGCHVHGGTMDYLVSQGKTGEAVKAVEIMREQKIVAGLAGHQVKVFQWAEKNISVDYYMCSYYNPSNRELRPEHIHGAEETYLEEDRSAMLKMISSLSKPVIHYKVLAAGRNNPDDAFRVVAGAMRPSDMVCVGVSLGDDPAQLEKDVSLFLGHLKAG
jgi:hypothetical protein